MRWRKLVERSALLVCEDAPSGCIESIEQGAAAQQIVPDRCEQLRNLGLKIGRSGEATQAWMNVERALEHDQRSRLQDTRLALNRKNGVLPQYSALEIAV